MNYREPTQFEEQKVLLRLLVLFYVAYLACTIAIQVVKEIPPSKGGGPTDQMNGALIWMISITALLIAAWRVHSVPKFLLWLGVSAAAGLVAVDEVFELHEKTRHTFGEDDYVKNLTIPAALAGMYILYRVEQPSSIVIKTFLFGFLFHVLYILTDMGDGDYFTLPIARMQLLWTEEILEIIANQGYLAGMLLHFTIISRPKSIPT